MISHKKVLYNKTISANEMELWHGTRTCDPSTIYNGKTGEAFDITYCNDGCMWGKGAYFAKNAKYSVDYSYNSGGSKKFMLCLVALGDCTSIPSNSSLK